MLSYLNQLRPLEGRSLGCGSGLALYLLLSVAVCLLELLALFEVDASLSRIQRQSKPKSSTCIITNRKKKSVWAYTIYRQQQSSSSSSSSSPSSSSSWNHEPTFLFHDTFSLIVRNSRQIIANVRKLDLEFSLCDFFSPAVSSCPRVIYQLFGRCSIRDLHKILF